MFGERLNKTISVRFSEQTYEQLEKKARDNHMTVANYMRAWIEETLIKSKGGFSLRVNKAEFKQSA